MKKTYYNSRLFIIILVVIIIFSSGYALTTVYNFRMFYVKLIISISLLPPFLKKIGNLKLNYQTILPLLLFMGIVLTMISNNFDNVNAYIGYLVMILLSMEIVVIYEFRKFVNMYIYIMRVLAIISLVGYILVNFLSLTLPIIININNSQYGNGYLYFTLIGNEIRNTGVFWEPGVYASLLVIALILTIFDKKSKNRDKVLFCITLITTNSSAGFLLLFLTLSIPLYIDSDLNSNQYNLIRRFKRFLLFIILLIIIFNLNTILNTFFRNNQFLLKLLSENVFNSSRFNAIFINWDIFQEYKIFGIGVTKYGMQISSYTNADMATSISLLAIFGIFGIIFTISPIIGIFNSKEINIYVKTILVCIMIIILNKEPHHNILVSWILIFYILMGQNLSIQNYMRSD